MSEHDFNLYRTLGGLDDSYDQLMNHVEDDDKGISATKLIRSTSKAMKRK